MTGLFLAFEGIDGCGKGTQAKLLAKTLFDMNKKHHVVLTREPGRSDLSAEVRQLLATESDPYEKGLKFADLYIGDRRDHVAELINPVLSYGGIVISDRYKHSTLAYQQAQGIPLDELVSRHHGLPVPDLTFIFDLSAEEAAKRMAADENRDYLEVFEKVEFQEKLRENYLKMPHDLEGEAITILDATQSIEAIHEQVMHYTIPLLYKVA
jgi:dTMP kinase